MIYARLFDGGTELRIQAADEPGLDVAWWTDARVFEESVFDFGQRRNTQAQNAVVENVSRRVGGSQDRTVRAWPDPFPSHSWIDWTARYRRTSTDGFALSIHYPERFIGGQGFPVLPAGELEFDPSLTPSPDTERETGRLLPERSWRDVRELHAGMEDPESYVRLDTLNEAGGTRLQEPIALRIRGERGSVVPVLPDQSLFDPFDLREDRYRFIGPDGQVLGRDFAYLNPRGFYNLHLRPRRWKFFVTVHAIFWHISWFELFPVREVFSQAWYDRPPTYPLRHNLHNFNIFTTDPAVLWQFEHSQAAADLTDQIFDAQWWSLSEAHIFGFVELVQMWIERAAPRKGETVLVVERIDQATGRTFPIAVQNAASDSVLDDAYPTQDIAFFQEVPWSPIPGMNTGIG